MRKTYLVTANHTCPEYQFDRTEVKVGTDHEGSYAMHPKLGCGKIYPTPLGAIHGLFSDHACKVTSITVSYTR